MRTKERNRHTQEDKMPRVTRTQLANGRYRYEVDGRVDKRASKVLYTHAAIFQTSNGLIATFHKTESAAMKTRGEVGPDGPYWTKVGHVTIEEVGA